MMLNSRRVASRVFHSCALAQVCYASGEYREKDSFG